MEIMFKKVKVNNKEYFKKSKYKKLSKQEKINMKKRAILLRCSLFHIDNVYINLPIINLAY